MKRHKMPKKTRGENEGTPKLKREHSGERTLHIRCSGSESYLFNHSVSCITNIRFDVSIRTSRHLGSEQQLF